MLLDKLSLFIIEYRRILYCLATKIRLQLVSTDLRPALRHAIHRFIEHTQIYHNLCLHLRVNFGHGYQLIIISCDKTLLCP